MKKLVVVLLGFLFLCNSCSTNNSTGLNSNLPKKIVTTESNGQQSITTYEYNDNKLVSSTLNTSGQIYIFNNTYTGNLITNKETFANGLQIYKDEYTYDLDKLVYGKTIDIVRSIEYRAAYTNNSDNTIDIVYSNYDMQTAIETITSTAKMYFSNGNLIKKEINNLTSTPYTQTITYAYDGKNNPFKNVLGNRVIDYNSNNTITEYFTSTYQGSTPNTSNYSYTYNNAGFPTKKVYSSSSTTSTTEYFY